MLGVAAPCQRVRNVDPRLSAWNFHALRTEVVAPFYPLPVRGLSIVLALYAPAMPAQWTLRFAREGTDRWFTMQMHTAIFSATEDPPIPSATDVAHLVAYAPWHVVAAPFPEEFALIEAPCVYRVVIEAEDIQLWTGGIAFLSYTPEPLTAERISALRSDPHAAKSARFTMSCKVCRDTLTAYAGLDRSAARDRDAVWYSELPDEFRCRCGATVVDLRFMRAGFHSVLGQRFIGEQDEITAARLYEPSSLEIVHDSLAHLLSSGDGESRLQQFIQENPVLLHFLGASKAIPKAPILSKYETDFAVLTASGDLVLIEIEADGKRLLRRDGRPTSEVTHAVSQVNDWLHELRTHRLACLSNMNLQDSEVARIRGLVIMGRTAGHDLEQLRKLKASFSGEVAIMTYDDLAASMAELIREVKRSYQPRPAG